MVTAAQAIAGIVTRTRYCEQHREDYTQILMPPVQGQPELWAGGCKGCSKDEALRQRARQRLPDRRSEIEQRVNLRMKKLEKQIAKEAKQQLEDYLADVRQEVAPKFEAHVRGEHWNRELLDVEEEIVVEEVEKLRQLTPSASAAGG